LAYFKDDYGRIWDYDDAEEAARDNLVPATAADVQAHNQSVQGPQEDTDAGLRAVAYDDDLKAIGQGAQRGLERITKVAGSVLAPAVEAVGGALGYGTPAGLEPTEIGTAGIEGHAFPEAFSEEARRTAEANPISAGIGGAIATTPFALAAGAAAPAGATLLGAGLGGVVTESAVEAVAQEYDDAWLEQRPAELANVAAYTFLFAGADFALRGLFKAGKNALFGGPDVPKSTLSTRNVISEAEAQARPKGEGLSIGAARAADLDDPFDAAVHMSDRDAAVLTRDASDHLNLAATHAADEMTRVNQGLTDSLGSRLKYADFAENAATWEPKTLELQAKAISAIVEEGDAAARSISAFAEGDKSALDFGNIGKQVVKDLDTFQRQIMDEPDPGRRNWLMDELKKRLDSRVMSINASGASTDAVTRSNLLEVVQPVVERYRKALESPKLFPGNGELQQSLNRPWHDFLKHWRAVQDKMLEATGHVEYGVTGAGRIEKEATVDRMMALFNRDPRSNKEFQRHLSGAFDGLQGLIEARQARGIVGTEGLSQMAADVANIKEAWNLATTVGVARNRAAHLQRDPRKWAKILGEIGERAPGLGQGIGILRAIGRANEPLYLAKDSPLFKVWDRGLRRFAHHPSLQDPGVAQNYSDWMLKALRERGGPVTDPGMFPPPAVAMPGPGPVSTARAVNDTRPVADQIAIAARRRAQGGAVEFGARASKAPAVDGTPVSLVGLELGQISKLGDDGLKPDTLEWLRKDERFAKTGKRFHPAISDEQVASGAGLGHGEGIILRSAADLPAKARAKIKGPWYLQDGRHAVKVGRERGLTEVFGRVLGRDNDVLFEGMIPIAERPQLRTGERGAVDMSSIATSPMGLTVGAGAAATVGATQLEPQPSREPYREALSSIAKGGQSEVQRFATSTLRGKPGKGHGALRAFTGKRPLGDSLEAIRESLGELSSDPARLVETLAGNVGDLARTHPGLYMQMVQKAGQLVGYLQLHMPPPSAPNLLAPDGYAISLDRTVDFAFRYTGAALPRQAMRDISAGEAGPEEAQAFQENWPELWEQFRADLVGQAIRRAEAGRPVESERLRRLDSELGMGGQLDPSASPDVTLLMLQAQDAADAQKQAAGPPKGGGAGSKPMAGAFQTRLAAVTAESSM
jgi:hypothetical protein